MIRLPQVTLVHPWVASLSAVIAVLLFLFLLGALFREYAKSPNAHHHVIHGAFAIAVLAAVMAAAYLNGLVNVPHYGTKQVAQVSTSHAKKPHGRRPARMATTWNGTWRLK